MELEYQFHPHDFPTVYRLLRPVTRRSFAITVAYVLGALAPTTFLLAYQDNLMVAAPIYTAALLAVFWGQRSARRHMRRQFDIYCQKRTVRIDDQLFEAEWEHGWLRCDWSMFAEVGEHQGWLTLRREGTCQLGAILPPMALQQARDKYQCDLKSQLSDILARRRGEPQPIAVRAVAGERIQQVRFSLDHDEAAVIAERGFQARNAANTSPWSFCITMGVGILALTYLPLPDDIQTLANHVLLPAMLLVLAMASLAPVKRMAYGKFLGDPALREAQWTSILESGVEQRQERMQSFARWPLLATVVDAKRFVAVLTVQGGIVCVPRRAFEPGQDDLFLQRIAQAMRRQQELEEEQRAAESAPVDTGNPYQPPATM